MAQQIKVNSSTGNIQIQISRGAIGPSTTANVANTALNLNAASTANVIIGGGVANYVLSTDGAGNTSWVAQTGGGATNPAGANTQVQFNDQGSFGAESTFTYDKTTDTLTTGTISATNIGNITPINLDGNVANVLAGDGTFIAAGGGATTPGGSNTQVQYNDNGAFGGEAVFTYDDVTDTLTAPNITATTQFEGDINGAVLLRCFNNTGSTINKGQLVYLPGGNNGDQPYIDLADSSDINKMPAFGVVKQNITPSSSGEVVTLGELTGLNLTGFTTGDTLYVNGVGAFQNTAPTGEADFVQSVGKVINGGTGGAIEFTGAGRVNQTPNLNDGNIFIGNATNQATTANLYGEINTHLAAFGSNTITTTGNVETGNLTATTSLFVDGVDGNVLIQPNVTLNGNTYSSIVRGEYNTGTGNSTTDQAFVTDNYTTQGITNIQTFANTAAGALAEGPSLNFNNYAAIGNTSTDPLVAGQIQFVAYPDAANLANASTGTGTTLTMGGQNTDGFLIVQGTNAGDAYSSEVWKQFQYRPKAMGFIRRGGNADSRSSPVANDETSINFYTTQTNGGVPGQLYNWPAKMGSKVDPGWTDPNDPNKGTPEGLFFTVVSEDFANLEHRMYANGDTIFNTSGGGTPITLGYNGVITGDGGGLSNISVSAGSQIINGTSNVSVALDGNVTAGIAGTADMLVLSTDGANVKNKVFIDNADGNVLLDPNVAFNSDTFTNITRGEYDSGTSLSSLNTAIVTDNYAGTGKYSQIMYANTAAGQIAQGPKVTFDDKSAIGNTNTDPYVTGQIEFSTAVSNSNRAATSTATHTSLSIAKPQSTNTSFGGITIDTGSNLHLTASEFQTGSLQQYQYQNRSMELFRQRGDGANPEGVAAGDEAAIHFFFSSNGAGNVGSSFDSYSAAVSGKVDSSFVGNPGEITPVGIEIQTTSAAFDRYNHTFYGNGDVVFNSSAEPYNPNPKNSVSFSDGLVTANAFTATTGVFTGDGGGLSNVSATATPAGFADSVQYNDGGTALGGDSTFTYSSSAKQLSLTGQAAGVGGVPTFNIDNGGFNVNQEEIGGGAATFAFNNYYAGSLIAPTTFFRARGTKNSPTQVASGDQIVNEGYYVNSGTGHTYVGVGGQTATVQANDGLGNVAVTYSFATAKPANGPNSLDKILFDTEFTQVAGNLQMNNTSASFVAGRIRQITDIFANLPASPITGERAMITDGPAFSFGAVVASGGGTNVMPVYWDGSNWRQG